MLKSYITRIVEQKILPKWIVPCQKCKALIDPFYAHKVYLWHGYSIDTPHDSYCPSCAPAYDKVIDGRYYKTDVEVDESGKVIKKN